MWSSELGAAAQGFHISDWTAALLWVGGVVLAIGFFLAQFRIGRMRGAAAALELRKEQIQALEDANRALHEEVSRYKAELDRLAGTVEQLREENRELRELLMGAKVQPALYEAMQSVARSSVGEVQKAVMDAILEVLTPIQQGLSRLLTAKDEEREEGS